MAVPWGQFGILYAAALVGAASLTPFTLRLVRSSTRPMKVPPAVVAAAGFAQNAVLFALVVIVGLLASHAVGLGAPYAAALASGVPQPPSFVPAMSLAAATGGAVGLAMTGADLAMLPRLPALLELARKTSLLENFLASFYGGVDEELLTRLLGVSGVTWLISKATSAPPAPAAFWSAIVLMAVLFALGHLPAAKTVVGRITALILTRTLLLNLPLAILCGWLFWRYGIEAAIVAHFSADIVYHVGGTALLQANDRRRFFRWIPGPAGQGD